jgi:hypothetical protein
MTKAAEWSVGIAVLFSSVDVGTTRRRSQMYNFQLYGYQLIRNEDEAIYVAKQKLMFMRITLNIMVNKKNPKPNL